MEVDTRGMRDYIRRTTHIDNLIDKTYYPFIASITTHPLPSKFKIPTLDFYNGTQDPCNHIVSFKSTMHLQGVPDKIMCKSFPITLKGLTRVWFSNCHQIL